MEAWATGTSTSTGPSRGALHVLPVSSCIYSQAMPGLEVLRCYVKFVSCTLNTGSSSELSPDELHLVGQISFCQSISTCVRGYVVQHLSSAGTLASNCPLPAHALDHTLKSTSQMHCCTSCWVGRCRLAGDAIGHVIRLVLILAGAI